MALLQRRSNTQYSLSLIEPNVSKGAVQSGSCDGFFQVTLDVPHIAPSHCHVQHDGGHTFVRVTIYRPRLPRIVSTFTQETERDGHDAAHKLNQNHRSQAWNDREDKKRYNNGETRDRTNAEDSQSPKSGASDRHEQNWSWDDGVSSVKIAEGHDIQVERLDDDVSPLPSHSSSPDKFYPTSA